MLFLPMDRAKAQYTAHAVEDAGEGLFADEEAQGRKTCGDDR